LKIGDALSSLLFNLALMYAIRRIQVNQVRLKLNGTYQILVHANDANILGGSIHTVKKNIEALVVASMETGQIIIIIIIIIIIYCKWFVTRWQ
jgi:hypothetical protein